MDGKPITTLPPVSTAPDSAPGDANKQADHSSVKITGHYQYTSPPLTAADLDASPLIQFNKWLAAASDPDAPTPVREPEAMAISTVSPAGVPSSRFVLLRGVDDRGFVFFTNYNSRKSVELAQNPNIAIVFYWKEVARQVRIIGRAEKVEKEVSDEYFNGRPKGSQIGAWASEQSKVIGDNTLKERVEEFEQKFGEGEVPRPEHWGGWRIIPR
jgi:pyridoxamine 5'-phosphate oxidase